MENLTLEKAKELAILKWQYIVDNDGSDYGLKDMYPFLNSLFCNCSYCELFLLNSEVSCFRCPINIDLSCLDNGSLFDEWCKIPSKENAKKVLDLIINTPIK